VDAACKPARLDSQSAECDGFVTPAHPWNKTRSEPSVGETKSRQHKSDAVAVVTSEDLGPHASVSAAVRGERDAQRALWNHHRRWVAAILLAHKPKWVDVEDLLQEVALTFVRKVGELREAGAIKPWLRTVAINAARAAAREGNRKEPGHATSLQLVGADGQPVHQPAAVLGSGVDSEGRDEARKLMSLAMELPEGYREPLLLKCLNELSYRQIGELIGLPETTVETRIARGRRMLRDLAMGKKPAEPAEPIAESKIKRLPALML
jgi:RNA polymerase sigma-70 factor, ECF subfamily